jgi:hypothetical protein
MPAGLSGFRRVASLLLVAKSVCPFAQGSGNPVEVRSWRAAVGMLGAGHLPLDLGLGRRTAPGASKPEDLSTFPPEPPADRYCGFASEPPAKEARWAHC